MTKVGTTTFKALTADPQNDPRMWLVRTLLSLVFIVYTLGFNAAEMLDVIDHIKVVDGEKVMPTWEHALMKWGPGLVGVMGIMPNTASSTVEFIRNLKKAIFNGGSK